MLAILVQTITTLALQFILVLLENEKLVCGHKIFQKQCLYFNVFSLQLKTSNLSSKPAVPISESSLVVRQKEDLVH